jgi:nucleotide-binding universal stress UspA family protein
MAMTKILVPLNGSRKDRVSLETAFALGKRIGAYVDAVFVHPDCREALPYSDMQLSAEIAQSIVDDAEKANRAAAAAARESFSLAAAEHDARIVSLPEMGNPLSTTFREQTGHLWKLLDREACLSDLVVFPSMTGSDSENVRQPVIDVLTRHCKPVLLCAERAPKAVGSAVLIGWDGGAAASHALLASLPILEKARAVQFACIGPRKKLEQSLHDAQEYLSLNGINACETLIEAPKLSIAEELLETAEASEYDLLVCGGYGHNHMLETLLGGTTDHLLSHSTVPVFLTH